MAKRPASIERLVAEAFKEGKKAEPLARRLHALGARAIEPFTVASTTELTARKAGSTALTFPLEKKVEIERKLKEHAARHGLGEDFKYVFGEGKLLIAASARKQFEHMVVLNNTLVRLSRTK